MVNLILAAVWLAVAVVLLVLGYLGPKKSPVDPSLGWIALVLVAYNLIRWWSIRQNAATQRALFEEQARRVRDRDEDRPEPPRTPDPNFDFTDRPSP